MKKYKINISPIVYDELKEIALLIQKISQSSEIAKSYLDEIESGIYSLEYFPERYIVIFERNHRKFRKVNIKKYSVFYYIQGDAVWISDILLSSSRKASDY